MGLAQRNQSLQEAARYACLEKDAARSRQGRLYTFSIHNFRAGGSAHALTNGLPASTLEPWRHKLFSVPPLFGQAHAFNAVPNLAACVVENNDL